MLNFKMFKMPLAGGLFALTAALAATSAAAQTVEEFYSENDLTLMVGASAGGSADFFARSIAPYLKKYIPGNPDIIVQNKRGAGGLIVASELQHTAPRDGTFISTLQRNNYVDPLLSDEPINFDAREVNHLGSVSKVTYVIFSYGDDPQIKSMDDVVGHEMILAGTGAGSANVTYPLLVNKLLGGKFNIVRGYSGNEEQALAIERGEADGRAISLSSTERGNLKQWKDAGKLHYVMQFAIDRNPLLSDIPNVFEAVTDDEDRAVFRFMLLPQEFGRPFAAPPEVPADRLAALREAFAKASEDPQYIADLAARGAVVDFLPGEELQEIANELMSTPPERVARIKDLLKSE